MAMLGVLLNIVGTLFLTHAVYSAHEHSTTFTTAPLPHDITIELIVSILLLCVGTVVSFAPLKPIRHAEWAGQISRQERKGEGEYTREGEEILSEGDPYTFLGLDGGIGGNGEGRSGFWDVRGKRREYEEWVRNIGTK